VAGVTIEYDTNRLFRPKTQSPIFWKNLETSIGLVKLFPGMPFEGYKALFDVSLFKALVIETFGSGNASSDPLFQSLITSYIQSGGLIVNVSQCSSGSVRQGKYETSSFFQKVGVVSGFDMTTEAALTKSMFVLSQKQPLETSKQLMQKSFCGEITVS
jgi:L-asparaginase